MASMCVSGVFVLCCVCSKSILFFCLSFLNLLMNMSCICCICSASYFCISFTASRAGRSSSIFRCERYLVGVNTSSIILIISLFLDFPNSFMCLSLGSSRESLDSSSMLSTVGVSGFSRFQLQPGLALWVSMLDYRLADSSIVVRFCLTYRDWTPAVCLS